MWRKSENIVHRLFDRQISTAGPNTHIQRARLLYENIVPSFTVFDVECPDYYFRKFSNDGQFLICFSRNYQNLIVYRHNGLSYCCKGKNTDIEEEFPSKGKKFESYFSQLYSLNLASGNEVICKDLFLATDCNCYGIFATTTAPDSDAPAARGAVLGVPSIEKITLYLVRLADGQIMDKREFRDDFIQLAHNVGIFMYDDLLSVLSVRYQAIHILQVREAGTFVDVRTIGPFCREDDELILNSHAQEEFLFQNERTNSRKAKGPPSEKVVSTGPLDVQSSALSLTTNTQGQQQNQVNLRDLSSQGYRGSGSGIGDNLLRTSRDSQNLHGGHHMDLFGTGQQNPSRDFGARRMLSDNVHAALYSSALDRGGSDITGSSGSHARLFGHYRAERVGQWPTAPSTSGNGLSPVEVGPAVSLGTPYGSASSESHSKRRGSQSLYLSSSNETRDPTISGGSITYGDSGVSVQHSSAGSVEYVVSSRVSTGEGSQWQSRYSQGFFRGNAFPPGTRETQTGISRGSLDAVDGSQTEDRILATLIADSGIGHVRSRVSQESLSRNNNSGENHAVGTATEQASVSVRAVGSPTTARSRFPGLGHRPSSSARPTQEVVSRDRVPAEVGTDLERGQLLGGIKQRLLSFIFRTIGSQDTDPVARGHRLKRFYYHFQHYLDLVMWKVQFLDRYHLLIKFGSVDGVVSHNSDTSNQTAFFVVYNIESTEILGFYQNSSEEFLQLFERYYDHFRVVPCYPLYMRFISSYSNNFSAREQLRKQKAACNNSKSTGYAQVVKRTLASLPCNSQSHSPSAYFDQSLFHFDEKLISATDQYKPCTEHPIKFISRRRPNTLKFKINPGLEFGAGEARAKRVASFIFHPIFPFAISVQQSFMQPSVVNFHFRR